MLTVSSQVPSSYRHPEKTHTEVQAAPPQQRPVDDRSTCPLRSPVQAIACRDEALCIVLLFGYAVAAFHHAHGE
ncbi:MAG: hypothetical protein M3R63_18260 [Actinomycetota bacterium]|nr:hypothetical protein [Actinomycetota bacterium]